MVKKHKNNAKTTELTTLITTIYVFGLNKAVSVTFFSLELDSRLQAFMETEGSMCLLYMQKVFWENGI